MTTEDTKTVHRSKDWTEPPAEGDHQLVTESHVGDDE